MKIQFLFKVVETNRFINTKPAIKGAFQDLEGRKRADIFWENGPRTPLKKSN